MLKLLNSVLLVVVMFGAVQSIKGEALQCQLADFSDFEPVLYECSVSALENPNDDIIITRHSGVHQRNKNDRDVEKLYIDKKNTKYIPEGLGSLFNLNVLIIQFSQLVEIRSKDFMGMQNLEILSLYGNKLTSVPSDAFSTLSKLKDIDLGTNKIKYIGSGAFDQLMNLKEVYLEGNICVNKPYVGATAITEMKEDIITKCKNPDEVPATTTTKNPME